MLLNANFFSASNLVRKGHLTLASRFSVEFRISAKACPHHNRECQQQKTQGLL